MKRSRGVQHLAMLAEALAGARWLEDGLRPTSLWAFGDILDPAVGQLDWVRIAVTLNLPPDDVHWFARPHGVEWLADRLRISKSPLVCMWRSDAVPVWNHFVDRPVLVWDESQGVLQVPLEALQSGRDVEQWRLPAPTADELRARLEEEAAVSYRAMQRAVSSYDQNRWSREKLSRLADPLWDATAGYLDVREALDGLG